MITQQISKKDYHMQKNNKGIQFVFFGTPTVAEETLSILETRGFIPALIVTAPDRPAGRKLALTPSPVKMWAQKHAIPVIQPEKIDEETLTTLRELHTELFIVVAYGKIVPQSLINIPLHGVLNIHYSLLPKYRGASPVESALLSGDTETGITIQKMELKMDTGPIVASEKVPIEHKSTTPALKKILTTVGGELLAKILPDWVAGKITPQAQDSQHATYCKKISKEDGLIDPSGDPIINWNKYRAYFGWPGVYFFVERGDKKICVIVTKAEFKDGVFTILKVIPEGKKEMSFADFSRA